jgi:regulator of replication initiation timing
VSPEVEDQRDRKHLLDRLHSLRTIVPVFAQELASARRQATRLRMENGRLLAEVRRLQRQHAGRNEVRELKLATKARPQTKSINATKGTGDVQYADQVARLG